MMEPTITLEIDKGVEALTNVHDLLEQRRNDYKELQKKYPKGSEEYAMCVILIQEYGALRHTIDTMIESYTNNS